MNEVPGFGAVRRREALRVPFELPTGLIGSGAQQDGLSQGAGVVEVAGGRTVRLAGQQPFLLVTDRLGDRGIGGRGTNFRNLSGKNTLNVPRIPKIIPIFKITQLTRVRCQYQDVSIHNCLVSIFIYFYNCPCFQYFPRQPKQVW